MKKFFKLFGFISLVAIISFLTACSSGDDVITTVPVTGVSLNKSSLSLTVGDSASLTATVAPDNAKDKAVTWTTSNAAKATVANGVVIAVAEGSAVIIVTTVDGSKTDVCSVTVTSVTSGTGIAPTITTATLPNGTTGTAYNQTLMATGDTPITWSVDSGTLPTGLILTATGVISGMPTTAGTSTFTVKATNAAGNNTKQFLIIIATADSGGGNEIEDEILPDAPAGLQANALTSSSVMTTWSKTNNANKYKIYRSVDNETFLFINETSNNWYQDNFIMPSTVYYYAVTAIDNNDNESMFSNIAETKTLSSSILSVPSGIVAVATTDSISVSWNDVANAQGYYLYYGTSSSVGSATKTTLSLNSKTIEGLSQSTTYYIWVSAYNASGEGSLSECITRTTDTIDSPKATVYFISESTGYMLHYGTKIGIGNLMFNGNIFDTVLISKQSVGFTGIDGPYSFAPGTYEVRFIHTDGTARPNWYYLVDSYGTTITRSEVMKTPTVFTFEAGKTYTIYYKQTNNTITTGSSNKPHTCKYTHHDLTVKEGTN